MTEMKNIKIGKFFKGFKELLDTNAPTIMTFGSVLGVIGTVYFMHRAAKEAAKVEEKYEEKLEELTAETEDEEELKEAKAHLKMNKCMSLLYIYRWALASGIGSAGFAILSNYLNGRTIMMLGTLLATNTDKLQKVSEKAKELVGEEKFKELKESVENELLGEKITKGEVKGKKPTKKEIAKNLMTKIAVYADFAKYFVADKMKIDLDDEEEVQKLKRFAILAGVAMFGMFLYGSKTTGEDEEKADGKDKFFSQLLDIMKKLMPTVFAGTASYLVAKNLLSKEYAEDQQQEEAEIIDADGDAD